MVRHYIMVRQRGVGCKGRLHRVLKLGQLPELDLVQRLPEVVKERFDRVRTWAERIEMKYLKMQTFVLESKTPSISYPFLRLTTVAAGALAGPQGALLGRAGRARVVVDLREAQSLERSARPALGRKS